MDQLLGLLPNGVTISNETLVIAGAGLAGALLFISLTLLIGRRSPAADRIARSVGPHASARFEKGLLRETVRTPRGLMRAAMPSDKTEREKQELKMIQAGLTHPRALQYYTIVRLVLGLALPIIFIGLTFAARLPDPLVPWTLVKWLAPQTDAEVLRHLVIIVSAGYYLPVLWLGSRIRERRQRITESFPNALDLMQISVEAGLGFDQAMTRVGNELSPVAPDIAFEFLSTQLQIQAGRPRGEALNAMAKRTGVDTVSAFANVVQQSIQFGTSMSEALTTYADEMRTMRELAAQEKANQLPVKMSGVLATLMLPALILVTIGPVIIRSIRVFGG